MNLNMSTWVKLKSFTSHLARATHSLKVSFSSEPKLCSAQRFQILLILGRARIWTLSPSQGKPAQFDILCLIQLELELA